jgi:hypothetical protein
MSEDDVLVPRIVRQTWKAARPEMTTCTQLIMIPAAAVDYIRSMPEAAGAPPCPFPGCGHPMMKAQRRIRGMYYCKTLDVLYPRC